MPVTSSSTVYYVDFDKLREVVKSEKALRGVTLAQIQEQTGIHGSVIVGFLKDKNLGPDAFVTFAKWANVSVNDLITRRRNAYRHQATTEEKKIRQVKGVLDNHGFTVEAGESPIDAMIRHLLAAKEAGNA